MTIRQLSYCLTLAICCSAASAELSLDEAIDVVQSVEPGAASHVEATAAVRRVESFGADALVPLAGAIGGNPLADNWLRGAFEAIAANGIDRVRNELLNFFADRENNPRARRLVFETVTANDSELRRELLNDALDDPSEEMRSAAVTQLLKSVDEAGSEKEKLVIYRRALKSATVRSQVDEIAREIDKLGGDVDKKSHFGFLTEWKAVGPFDNKDKAGFDVEFGPEAGDLAAPDPQATYEGTLGETTWQSVSTDADNGIVDLAEQLGPHKGALVYVTTTFESDSQRPVDLRLSTANAWKLWLNGQPLFEREEYHRGLHWDQYRIPAVLQKGSNVIVIKVLQNEQEQSWAQRWSYSLRITDPDGQARMSLASTK